ncbi:Gfo/Idh/MocA family protein [Salinibacter ruber]|uniref:Gfo/Idh/MocA family protein n=1 Tax=Salinibacter ruber TaxID=146919 RepID=UPI00216A9AAE|nr:Gfo/Idh/MocA family oxidoreductase [Salinibacter ruber]MCS3611683.1 putative dehydrogenase [Salinibacter ruber]
MALNRTIRYGMVGGGPGAFIGAVHRSAAALDGEMNLVAGAFSSSPEKSREQGDNLHLDPDRVYDTYEEMADAEAERPDGIDVVSIVTPNFLHHDVARIFIDRGFHVICDKPMTTTLEDAEDLCRRVDEQDVVFCLTYNYAGYPLVKQARALVEQGRLGALRKIVVEYPQGWLNRRLEAEGNKQASWRTDPDKAGAGALGDIGTHAEHLARYVTGLSLERICADVGTVVEGRPVDDDASILARYEGGVRGLIHVSQISAGEENNLRLRVYGTEAGLDWRQEDPHRLTLLTDINGEAPQQIYSHGRASLADSVQPFVRTPQGHPEGFIEAFANLYRSAAHAIAAHEAGVEPEPWARDFPTVQDGAAGVHFIETALESSEQEAWVDASYTPPRT